MSSTLGRPIPSLTLPNQVSHVNLQGFRPSTLPQVRALHTEAGELRGRFPLTWSAELVGQPGAFRFWGLPWLSYGWSSTRN